MSVVQITRVIARPRAEVFATIADFAGVHRYHPAVESSPLNPGTPTSGVGCERTCTFYDGNSVEERITRQVDGERIEVEIFNGSLPLAKAKASFTLHDAGEGTRVDLTMDYTVKYGIVGQVMDSLMMRSKFEGLLTLLLAALEEHLVTGQEIGQDWAPRAAA